MTLRTAILVCAGAGLAVIGHLPVGTFAQQPSETGAIQRVDEEYTRLIRQHLQDERISTTLVDHLPASDTVPSPLKFFGRAVGTPGELTYAGEIQRYYEALARASSRARLLKIGTSEEGRDIVALAIADEATMASLEPNRRALDALTDPRVTSEDLARAVIATAKPVYYIVSGVHSPENGGPEMLIELAYRLVVQESPFVQEIRANVLTLITPVLEVDGREKQVDTYYFNKNRPPGEARLPLVYWGKYVQHDNNRDGMGQALALTQAVTRVTLDWRPTILHDLHESQAYLYTSTGTGPYNEALDPIAISEWWMLAENEVLELTKRDVPGVWTYGFYDGWVPNYIIFVAHSHNAVGRFYEVQGYGPDPYEVRPGPTALSREWFRANPPLPFMRWGPRNNVNIQQSALLLSLNHVARNRRMYVENYWLKNKRAVAKGRSGPVHAWVIPANQPRKGDAARAVNDLRRQGLEVSRASARFVAGDVVVNEGDYVIRGDQPFRTLAEMYFSVQRYSPQNPAPYDDTGWTFQLLRDIVLRPITAPGVLAASMTFLREDARPSGGVVGSGPALVVEHRGDTSLVTFRFRHADVRMWATEEHLRIATASGPHTFPAGSIVVPDADRARIEPTLRELGLTAWAAANPLVQARPPKVHEVDVPRIGFVHSWTRTQDEGWWRAAFDAYAVPYTYFSDQRLREGNLRTRFEVLVYPHVGGSLATQVHGLAMAGSTPLPYKKTVTTPNLGTLDSSDDIRGGMGLEGLVELAKFVREGGTLIVDGSSASLFPYYGLTPGVNVEEAGNLFARGTILRARIVEPMSPIAYGYPGNDVAVYFNDAPVLSVGAPPASPYPSRPNAGLGQLVTPNATLPRVSSLDGEVDSDEPSTSQNRPQPSEVATLRNQVASPSSVDSRAPRVVLQFGDARDLLLSGALADGERLSARAAVVDAPLGTGHVVMFAIRPFWRWQTHGTYTLGFNAILNWNDLNAGR